jgi:glycosyltransferase involved in cell wall biosynthesis
VVLPALVHKLRSDLLVSPCNWGPIGVRAQLPLFHDAAPMFHPQYFTPSYVRLARQVMPRLVRRATRSAVTCDRVKQELIRYTGARADRIDVIPPGVGAPFTDLDVDPARPRSPRCVFIGGYDVRKNLGFLWRMWPRVHAELGLELHVVARAWTSTRRIDGHSTGDLPAGVVVHTDTDDTALADLLADSLCLLWPSHYEGYGLPLLEAMAVSTPFISSDTGAARELAVVAGQVLPLCPGQWFDQLRRWRTNDPVDLRRTSMDRARRATWSRSAEALVEAVERTAAA